MTRGKKDQWLVKVRNKGAARAEHEARALLAVDRFVHRSLQRFHLGDWTYLGSQVVEEREMLDDVGDVCDAMVFRDYANKTFWMEFRRYELHRGGIRGAVCNAAHEMTHVLLSDLTTKVVDVLIERLPAAEAVVWRKTLRLEEEIIANKVSSALAGEYPHCPRKERRP